MTELNNLYTPQQIALTRANSTRVFNPRRSSLLPNTAALVLAAGLTNTDYITGLNTFEGTLRDNNLLSKFHFMYLYLNDKATNAERAAQNSFNFINPALYQMTWNGGITHAYTGIKGNGTNGYGSTGFNPNGIVSLNSTSIFTYTREDIDNDFQAGCYIDPHYLTIIPKIGTNYVELAINGDTPYLALVTGTGTGLAAGNRSDSSAIKFYWKGIDRTISWNQASTIIPNSTYTVLAISGYASTVNESCFDALASSMTASEHLIFYNAVQALQTVLNRQV